jgi:3-isopropylmalate dehydrogenase
VNSSYQVAVLEGDGIGPEIVPPTVAVMEQAVSKAGAGRLEWTDLPTGYVALDKHGTTLPDSTIETLAQIPAWVVGPHDSSGYPEPWVRRLSPHARLRKEFALFANVRPVRNLPGVQAVAKGMDLVFVREGTEGFYSDNAMFSGSGQFMPAPGVAINVGVFTVAAAERIAHVAFRMAQQRRRRVTVVHKALLKPTLGLYLEVARSIAPQYPDVELNDVHVDASTVYLVRDPGRFDVLLTENMHGDILSDLAGELAGALGMTPSLNEGVDAAMAQAAHGCAPDIAGKNIANPVGMMLSGAMLLAWMGARYDAPALVDASRLVEEAVTAALANGRGTGDLGRPDTTTAFQDAVLAELC